MSTEVQQQIQQDWENREFIEIVSEGIKKIAEFLNDFGELKLLSTFNLITRNCIISFAACLCFYIVNSFKLTIKSFPLFEQPIYFV